MIKVSGLMGSAALVMGVLFITSGSAVAQGQSETLDTKSSDVSKASDMPLDKVCLQRSDIYSAGAVVTMNEKPYVCKMDKNMGTGTLSWVPMEPESGA